MIWKIANIKKLAANIKIIPVEEWTEGKSDPTEYSYEHETIRVREDYDYIEDPAGWIVHENVHASMPQDPAQATSYPDNPVERAAYGAQLKYLKDKGYSFEQIFTTHESMEHLNSTRFRPFLEELWNSLEETSAEEAPVEN